MIRKLYSFYNLPLDHDTCHLFEHLVLRTFLIAAQKSGNHRAFIGTINGQTINSSVFFAIEVHNKSLQHLFEHTLKNPHKFSEKLIKQSIRHIEAEMSSVIDITDMTQLRKSLVTIYDYINDNETTTEQGRPQLSITAAPDLFEKISLSIETTDASDHMTKLFYIMHPIVMDIVRDICFDNISAYPASPPSLTAYIDGTVATQEYIVRKLPHIDISSDKATSTLRNFDINPYASYMSRLASSLLTDTTFAFLPLNFYEKAEAQTSIKELASLITPHNFHTLVNELNISIRPVE